MYRICLDFSPGTHGHFLEYVLNRYLFKSPTVDNLWQPSGACHWIDADRNYKNSRVVFCQHRSSLSDEKNYDSFNDVIFIKHNPKYDFVLLTNIFHRCHPKFLEITDIKVIQQAHIDSMKNGQSMSIANLRNNWYTKLIERHFEVTEKRINDPNVPSIDFDYGNFFSLNDFLFELRKIANHLSCTFEFDPSLVILWKDFMDRNQGWKSYVNGLEIFSDIVGAEDKTFESDWKLQSFLNYLITCVFDLYEGEIFSNDNYPTNTLEIFQTIKNHVQIFDQQF